MSDPTVTELVAEAVRLTRENRALRWLAQFGDDRDLTAILAVAKERGSLDDVLVFLHWALERDLLELPEALLQSGFERRMRSDWAPAF